MSIASAPTNSTARSHTAPEFAVVVPTFNESANIAELYRRVGIALEGTAWEMIVVDDNSPDGTADLAWTLGRSHANIRCIKRVGRRGLGTGGGAPAPAPGAPGLRRTARPGGRRASPPRGAPRNPRGCAFLAYSATTIL